ncbi:hypothetical protein ACG1BZ_15200 [Microbulbifer sp. CNSA002]|uniref:hypothetical protein n=1 Tax=unclassified Microbulbifer TaxID=2619833 RepID=UPI0039B53C83
MPTNYYKAPKANLESKTTPSPQTISFLIALKATALTCVVLPTIIAVFSLPGASGIQILNGTVPMLTFYLMTTLVSLIATLTYGKLIEYFLLKMQRYNRVSMMLGGALPSILLCCAGIATTESGFFGLAFIIALYSIPIAFLCHYFVEKSGKDVKSA